MDFAGARIRVDANIDTASQLASDTGIDMLQHLTFVSKSSVRTISASESVIPFDATCAVKPQRNRHPRRV